MKILILMPCWQRPEILDIVIRQWNRCIESVKEHELKFAFVVSQEDPQIDAVLDVIARLKTYRTVLYISNESIGAKIAEAVEYAVENIDFDYLMNTGSDDLIHEDIFEIYRLYLKFKEPVFGLEKLYFWNKDTDEVIFYSYYNNPHVVGAGRMICRNAIKDTIRRTGWFYDPKKQRCLDADSGKRLKVTGYSQIVCESSDFPYIVDIKTCDNINKWESVTKAKMNFNRIETSNIKILKKAYKHLFKYGKS